LNVIRVTRSQPAPASLAEQKLLKAGRYNSEDVVERLQADFRNKCYLCEESKISVIQIDHLQPPGENRDLRFDWNNLFYSCGHCNGTKSDTFWPMLDCTDPAVPVLSLLRYAFEVEDKELRARVDVTATGNNDAAGRTAALLQQIHGGQSSTRGLEAANIVDKIQRQCRSFFRVVRDLAATKGSAEDRTRWRKRIARELAPETSFTAIRAWYVLSRLPAEEFRPELERLGYAFEDRPS
jgi:hypothetical protein